MSEWSPLKCHNSLRSVSNISQTPDERKGLAIDVSTRKWALSVISINEVLHHFQPLCIKCFYRHKLANDLSVRKQILSIMSVHAWSLENISICALLCCIFTDKWWEKWGSHNKCKGEQLTLLNYILVKSWSLASYHNPLDIFTIFQAFDVKADVDQTNREVRLYLTH